MVRPFSLYPILRRSHQETLIDGDRILRSASSESIGRLARRAPASLQAK